MIRKYMHVIIVLDRETGEDGERALEWEWVVVFAKVVYSWLNSNLQSYVQT